MARQESDREDLMREAIALIRRMEFSYPGQNSDENVTAGFRRGGQLAIYFGADPVFQFDEQYRLRRAYSKGFLYRTQGKTLARLSRERTPEETVLLRHDLEPAELAAFLLFVRTVLGSLLDAIKANAVEVIAEIPSEGNLLSEIGKAVERILEMEVPLAPPIPGKK